MKRARGGKRSTRERRRQICGGFTSSAGPSFQFTTKSWHELLRHSQRQNRPRDASRPTPPFVGRGAGRVTANSLIGLNLSPSDVPNVKQRLGIGTPLAESSPEEILGLLAGGAVIELDNGWHLTMARIAGDDVVEVVLNGVPANRAELEGYGLSEENIGYKRRWFTVLEVAPGVLPRILAHCRPVRDLTDIEHVAEGCAD